jgi:alkaline phosphatase D
MFLWLGDNVYHDTLEPETMDAMWAKQLNIPNLQSLLRTVPQLSIWDDHDFGLNDHDRTNPVKDAALASYKRNWANPSYGLADTPGVFYKFSYANVDFFMLDGRYYRDPNDQPDGPSKTFLGARQLQWLKDGLKQSRADFKILACGSGWTNAKGHGGDSWASAITERNALFDFIRDEKVEGVVLLSGDTHIGELNAIPWSEKGGYDLYDLVSSPLANENSASFLERRPERRIRQVYFSGTNFGMLSFDSAVEPTLTFSLHNESGRNAFAPMTLRASELKNGVSTWLAKMDPLSRRRWDATQSGKPTYSGG